MCQVPHYVYKRIPITEQFEICKSKYTLARTDVIACRECDIFFTITSLCGVWRPPSQLRSKAGYGPGTVSNPKPSPSCLNSIQASSLLSHSPKSRVDHLTLLALHLRCGTSYVRGLILRQCDAVCDLHPSLPSITCVHGSTGKYKTMPLLPAVFSWLF